MSVSNPVPGEVFTARVFKRATLAPGTTWSNSYEVVAQDGASSVSIQEFLARLMTFESLFHSVDATIYRATISTYVPDTTTPYNPDNLYVLDAILQGAYASESNLLPFEISLFVRRLVNGGRTGKLFYRACLFEEDIVAVAGKVQFAPGRQTATQTRFQNAITNSGLQQHLGSEGAVLRLCMARGSPQPSNVRTIASLAVDSVRFLQTDFRFYNRQD